MSAEAKLAWRYFRSTRHHPFIHVIKNISILGVALGVAALIVVLAVMSGFETDLKEQIIGTFAHSSVQSDEPFQMTPELTQILTVDSPEIAAIAPFVQGQALIQKDKMIEGVLAKGSTAQNQTHVTAVGKTILRGAYPAETAREVLLGDVLASILRVDVGGEVQIISPDKRKPIPLKVSGITHSGMYEYDAHLVYLPLDLAQEIFKTKGAVSGVELRYHKMEDAVTRKHDLQVRVGYPLYVKSWNDMNRNLFNALKLERTVMFIILTLIVTVACFNIVGTLTMLVIDKTKDIGIMKSLGFTGGQIMRIFTWNGLLIGFCGTSLGLAIGAGICLLLDRYSFIDIPSDIYYFGKLPVHLDWTDTLTIAACSLALSLISTLYPAIAGSRLKPVEALRYE